MAVRRLMWFTLGACGAYALGVYVQMPPWQLVLLLGILSFLAFLVGRSWKTARRAAVLLLGMAAAFLWLGQFQQRYLAKAAALDGTTQSISVQATDYSSETVFGGCVDGKIILEGSTYPVRVYLKEWKALAPGDRFATSFLCRATFSGGEEPSTFHQGQGIYLLLYQKGDKLSPGISQDSWQDAPARLRRQIRILLKESFPEDTVPFAEALLLGYTEDLDYETDTALKLSGIRHVAAVSGLHVSILFTLIGGITFHKRLPMLLLGIPALAMFAAVAGFTPSVCRACLMCGLMLLAPMWNAEYDQPTALSFAVLVILTMNPLAITSIGFQLSALSVTGIFLFGEKIRKWMVSRLGGLKGKSLPARLGRWFCASVSVTLSALSLTTPLCAYSFGTVSLIGVVTNLLTLWVISLIFYGLTAVCLLSLFWRPGCVILARGLSVLIRYVLLVAKTMSGIPYAAVYTRSGYIVIWLLALYGMLALFLLLRRKHPGVLLLAASFGLCLALWMSWAEPRKDAVRFTVFDVGQGQCLLLQSEGHNILVDCGGDQAEAAADIAAETLLSQGIRKLDCLVLTHLDHDHSGGVGYLLSRVDTDFLILPQTDTAIEQKTDGRVIIPVIDQKIRFGGINMEIYTAFNGKDSNESSLCVLFDTEKCDILITGDRSRSGEKALLETHELGTVDVLMAGHHGSKNATSPELVNRVKPKIVCVSAGRDNPYGHPAKELLLRLDAFGCKVYRTDRDGDIVIRR